MFVSRHVIPLTLGACFALVATALTLVLHPMEVSGPENDQYVGRLEELLAGRPCYDGFHPVHTQLLGAAIVKCTGCDAFTALRLISAISGGAIVALTFVLARSLSGIAAAWMASAAVAIHGGLLMCSMQAASDALATGLILALVLVAIGASTRNRRIDAFGAGLLFGLALGARSSAIGFAPVLVAPILVSEKRGQNALLIALGILIGYSPHAIVAWSECGSPLANSNWHNLVLKMGGFDPWLLYEPGYASVSEFLRARGLECLHRGGADMASQIRSGFGYLLLGGGPASLALLTTIGSVMSLVRLARNRAGGWTLIVCWISYLSLVCMTFVASERLLLPLIVIAIVGLACSVGSRRRWVSATGVGLIAIVAFSNVARLPGRVRNFVDLHPYAEVEAATELHEHHGVELVATTFSPLQRYVPFPVRGMQAPPNGSIRGDSDILAYLRSVQGRTGANGLVIGRRTQAQLYKWIMQSSLPNDVMVVRKDVNVVSLRMPTRVLTGADAAGWIGAFVVTPDDWVSGPLSVEIRLCADAPGKRVKEAMVTALVLGEKEPSLPLSRGDGHSWSALVNWRPPCGLWRLQARLRLDDGVLVMGPTIDVLVR